jgi:hypothetical protein
MLGTRDLTAEGYARRRSGPCAALAERRLAAVEVLVESALQELAPVTTLPASLDPHGLVQSSHITTVVALAMWRAVRHVVTGS